MSERVKKDEYVSYSARLTDLKIVARVFPTEREAKEEAERWRDETRVIAATPYVDEWYPTFRGVRSTSSIGTCREMRTTPRTNP
jgi:hypothetical protein